MARPGPSGGTYRPLNDEQVHTIHAAALQVLQRTGIQVEHDGALALYRQGGTRIQGQRVFLPPAMVERALQLAPSEVLLAGRDPAHDILLAGERVYAGTGGSPTQVLDPGAAASRPGTLRDLVHFVRLADALPHCDFCVMPLYPTDLDREEVPVNRFYACLRSTAKHVMGGVDSTAGARQVLDMACTVAGSLEQLQARPFISAITCWMVSPLRLDPEMTGVLIDWCGYGLPVVLSSAPMAGSTSPVTLAGTLVQLHAEQLSGVVLAQIVRPGTPLLAGYIPGLANLRSGEYLGGAIEFGMMQAAAAQLARHCHLPIYCSAGMTDSKLPDAQAGYEKMASLLLAAMGGCNYIHHAIGMMTNMSALSLEQAVLDDEMVGMAMRVLRGIAVDESSLAVDAIDRGGRGGHYLLDEHTLRFMRSEFFYPLLADRQNRTAWQADGAPDARTRAADRVKELLAAHTPPGLPPEVDAAIRRRFPIRLSEDVVA